MADCNALIQIRCTSLNEIFIKCFEHTDGDLIVTKLFILTWNNCVVMPYPTQLHIITPHRTE